jgi:hypothetical protein
VLAETLRGRHAFAEGPFDDLGRELAGVWEEG